MQSTEKIIYSKSMDKDAFFLPLDTVEARICGSLIEKSLATPSSYPLTLHDIVSACNQKTSRFPVMQLLAEEVARGLESLMKKSLVWKKEILGHRTPKFEFRRETLLSGASAAEWAALCVLILRGPQTAGGIKDKSERLYKFQSVAEVEDVLKRLMTKTTFPLIKRLPLAPPQMEERYQHLLIN
jgi:uncharacterized protein YceH (UPF0502 family)